MIKWSDANVNPLENNMKFIKLRHYNKKIMVHD